MSGEAPACQDCRHWEAVQPGDFGLDEGERAGICGLLSARKLKPCRPGFVRLEDPYAGGCLVTRHDFACQGFRPEPGREEEEQ